MTAFYVLRRNILRYYILWIMNVHEVLAKKQIITLNRPFSRAVKEQLLEVIFFLRFLEEHLLIPWKSSHD